MPADLGIKDGDNATIQVVTNGDPNGGLYNVSNPPLPPIHQFLPQSGFAAISPFG